MTDEIIKFDRYMEQAKLLMKYRIDTWEQLSTVPCRLALLLGLPGVVAHGAALLRLLNDGQALLPAKLVGGLQVTPEQAHEIGVELAQRLWGGRFQVVVILSGLAA